MTEVGRCSCCGAICKYCSPLDAFTLKALPEGVQDQVREVLQSMGASQRQTQEMVRDIVSFDEKHIKQACRIWRVKGYGKQGKSHGYFREIVRSCGRASEHERKVLDDLPPLVT